MALSKSPSILLLDNPVDQLDSESSFQFWKLLQELKTERSIIVTCTKLEEAELYGDRIAVLSKGKVACYGTPPYIKLAYGKYLHGAWRYQNYVSVIVILIVNNWRKNIYHLQALEEFSV